MRLALTAFAKSLALALDGFDLFTVHKLREKILAELGHEPGVLGEKQLRKTATSVLCSPSYFKCLIILSFGIKK